MVDGQPSADQRAAGKRSRGRTAGGGGEGAPGGGLGHPNGAARRAISVDGTRVFWESEGALYVRDTALRQTLQIASSPSRFQIASADGSRVFFNESNGFIECRIVVGPGGKLQCEMTDLTPVIEGESANVFNDILGASEDGSTLYFVAEGTLGTGPNARRERAIAGQPNLYVRKGASTSFIATLSGGDEFDWSEDQSRQSARVSPNGQWLAFMSERSLSGYDNHDAVSGRADAEVYVYDAGAGRLSCASCDPTGARPVGVEYHQIAGAGTEQLIGGREAWKSTGWVAAALPIPTAFGVAGTSGYQSRYLSSDGKLFFNSLDALVPQDVNGNWDVYEHEPSGAGTCTGAASLFSAPAEGCLGLVSSGSSAQQSAFLDASESGGDAFFITTEKLTTQDIDRNADVYDAHECTSASPCIAAPPVKPPPCSTESSCKAPPTPQPSIFGAPASATFSGPGNPIPPPASKPKVPTRAELLARALKSCRKRFAKSKARRRSCERQARKRHAAKGSAHQTARSNRKRTT